MLRHRLDLMAQPGDVSILALDHKVLEGLNLFLERSYLNVEKPDSIPFLQLRCWTGGR